MAVFGRALLRGAGFGLAIAVVEAWRNAARLLAVGLRSPLPMEASGAAMLIGLAVVVGGVTVAAARRGSARHVGAMVLVWCALQLWAAPAGGAGRTLALVPPLGGVLLFALGARLPRVAALAGMLALVAGLLAPDAMADRRATPPADGPAAAAHPGAPDVIVVVLDGVRADHLGAFGYARPTSPRFDAVAREGTLFTDAVAPATWSLPSQASLLTGRFPSAHGAHAEHPFLSPGAPTLAERFAAAGWETRAFTADAWISDAIGTTRGFRRTDEAWRRGDAARPLQSAYRLLDRLGAGATDAGGGAVAAAFESWLAARPRDHRPAFAFVDLMEANGPLQQVPDDLLARFTSRSRRELRDVASALVMADLVGTSLGGPDVVEQATALYDAGIAQADALLGRVVDALRRRGTLDRTVLVVLSDHGMLLGEHGELGHGRSLYEPVVHVPLLVRFPPTVAAGRRIDVPVSTVGVYATLLDLAGLPAEPAVQVGSLLAVIAGEPHPGPVVAEQFAVARPSRVEADDPLLEPRARLRAYRAGRLKLVDAEPGGTFLFDLDDDPAEEHEVSMKRRLEVAKLRDALDEWRERVGIPDLRAAVRAAAR